MKIFVTGGLGFIGSHTVVELLNAGYDVVVDDNLSNSSIDVIDKIKAITGKDFEFNEKLASVVGVIKIVVSEFTAKHRPLPTK